MRCVIRWLGLALGSLSLLVVVSACSTASSAASQPFVGSQWRLTQLNGQVPLATGEPISLGFQSEQQLGGNGGCNSYGGSYRIAGSDISIRELVSTERACLDPALNAQEVAYYQALQAVASYELVGDELRLTDVGGVVVLMFARA
jgi:heat shock protein HslJ